MIHFCLAADGKDVLMYQVDGCERKVMAGTFDRLVRQLAGEEKPGTYARGCSEGRRGDASIHVPSASLLLQNADCHYVTIFLYGMRHFAKPVDVAAKLIRRYPPHTVTTHCSGSTC